MKTSFAAIIVAAFIVSALQATAAQPALPTSVYGRIHNANNTPAEGYIVEAIWTDSSGSQQLSSTKTLTIQDATAAGHPEYAGYYFFNQGFIQAREGSQIAINAPGGANQEKTTAAPGKEALPIALIALQDPNDRTPPQISDVQTLQMANGIQVSFSTDELAKTEVRHGNSELQFTAENNTFQTKHNILLPGLAPGTFVYEVIAQDSSGNSVADSNNGSYYSFTVQPNGGQFDDLRNKAANEQASQTQNMPAQQASTLAINPNNLPTSIYGLIKDEEGDPVADAEVDAEWVDEQGKLHRLRTETLNPEQAEKLGNPELKGYYFFRENITLPSGTEVTISSPEKSYLATAKANPGGSSQAEAKKAVDAAKEQKNEPAEKPQQKPAAKKPKIDIAKALLQTARWLAKALAATLFVSLLLMFTASFWYYFNKKITEQKKLSNQLKKFFSRKANTFMTTQITNIKADKTIGEAAQLITEKEKTGVIVTEGKKPIGWVTERTIIEDILIYNLPQSDELRKATLLKPVVLKPDATLADAGSKLESSGQRAAIIMSEGKITGIITVTDIAEQLRYFYDTHPATMIGLPAIATAVKKGIVKAKKDSSLKDVWKAMSSSNSDCAVVYRDSPGERDSILTERDIFMELMKNPKRAAYTKAALAAKQPIITASWKSNLIDTNEAMLKAGTKTLPVSNQGRIEGIATLEEVTMQMLSHLRSLLPWELR